MKGNITKLNDLWKLDTVRNDFDVVPEGYSLMVEIHFLLHKGEIIAEEVQKLIAKGAIN